MTHDSADRPATTDQEIEVTPEMVDAGLLAWRSLYLDDLTGYDLKEDWLRAIYKAMFHAGHGEANSS